MLYIIPLLRSSISSTAVDCKTFEFQHVDISQLPQRFTALAVGYRIQLFGTQSSLNSSRNALALQLAVAFIPECDPFKPTTSHASHLVANPCLNPDCSCCSVRQGVRQSSCCSVARPEAAAPSGCLRD